MKRQVPEGAEVKISHMRFVEGGELLTSYEIKKAGLTPLTKGGRTEAVVQVGDVGALGVAECSLLDNYNRTIGRNIAIGRALKELHLV